jgi:hypothetical protein
LVALVEYKVVQKIVVGMYQKVTTEGLKRMTPVQKYHCITVCKKIPVQENEVCFLLVLTEAKNVSYSAEAEPRPPPLKLSK